ncbi:RluA family pseudouridine synthase [Pelagibacteraceae bacterium]|nr:RluA family pseudouridine synthase [Pelagibacteraceae bacterium]
MIYEYKVNNIKYNGLRLDKYISLELTHLSRSKIKLLINNKMVLVNGKWEDPDYKISLKDKIKVTEEIKNETSLKSEKIDLNVVYEDEDLIVIDKPAGIVMHPGAGNKSGTIVNALINHCGNSLKFVGDSQRPGIVHRIDKDTSGLVVVAKNDFSHQHLSLQFADHSIRREYIAVCWGSIKPASGKISSLISRSNKNRTKMMSSKIKGKEAITNYKTIENLKTSKGNAIASVIECKLHTGRTHQIRVHMTDKGHPLIGDKTYGRSPQSKLKQLSDIAISAINALPGQALHAKSLGFVHPQKEKIQLFQSVIPDYLSNLINSIKS